MIEVSVVEALPAKDSDQPWCIVVRCMTDIRLNDRFLKATPFIVDIAPERATSRVTGPAVPVDLVVRRIVSYQRELDLARIFHAFQRPRQNKPSSSFSVI